jgi:hypothetical protein
MNGTPTPLISYSRHPKSKFVATKESYGGTQNGLASIVIW